MADDQVLEEGDIQFTTAPQQTQLIKIPYHKPAIVSGKEYRVLVTSKLKKDEVWAKAGHEVAWNQLELSSWNLPAPTPQLSAKQVNAQEDEKQIKISGKDFSYVISKETGNLAARISVMSSARKRVIWNRLKWAERLCSKPLSPSTSGEHPSPMSSTLGMPSV